MADINVEGVHTITAAYSITTPMFCSGYDQKKAEVRLSSFKGALRFWWRTLMWSVVNDSNALRNKEAEIFGSSDQGVGQSKARLLWINPPSFDEPNEKIFENSGYQGIHYLGYGVMETYSNAKKGTRAGQLKDRGIIEKGEFTVAIRLASQLNAEQKEKITHALILLGTFGGLGSRSRKGFGSLSLTELALDDKPVKLPVDVYSRMKMVLGTLKSELPPWPAFSNRDCIIQIKGQSSALALLNNIGLALRKYRSYKEDKNFIHDHDSIRDYLSKGKEPKTPPERIAFGLPHNYFFSSLNKAKADVVAISNGQQINRRSSSLFIHVDITTSGAASAQLLFLPSCFLPEGSEVVIKDGARRRRDVRVPWSQDNIWQPITAFLDHLCSGAEGNLQAEEVKHG